MTKLTWDQVGDRFYETGIDRGVLYPQGGSGVAWNGLISVEEAPSGGEAKPLYIDGYKYMNRSSREEYAATIQAFTYPEEFEACDGTASLGKGLFFTQQRRKSFGLSYRSKIGNDVDGIDHGYKLHIVYNALAAPSSVTYTTASESPEVVTFNWAITTKPVRVAGYFPVPHVEIDSRKTPPSLMAAIEDILHGSAIAAPRQPTPAELVTLFTEWPDLLIIDNGDGTFTASGPDSVVSLLNPSTFQIIFSSAIDNGDGTYTVSSL